MQLSGRREREGGKREREEGEKRDRREGGREGGKNAEKMRKKQGENFPVPTSVSWAFSPLNQEATVRVGLSRLVIQP